MCAYGCLCGSRRCAVCTHFGLFVAHISPGIIWCTRTYLSVLTTRKVYARYTKPLGAWFRYRRCVCFVLLRMFILFVYTTTRPFSLELWNFNKFTQYTEYTGAFNYEFIFIRFLIVYNKITHTLFSTRHNENDMKEKKH